MTLNRSAVAALIAVAIAPQLVAVGGQPPAARRSFRLEEATIGGIHAAIRSGELTCRGLVQAYIDRAKAYNGTCTALVTRDGAPVPAVKGAVRAGAPIAFPTRTVPVSSVLPDFDRYAGPPIEFGRMEPTISDPGVQQQFGMRVGIPDAGQVNALETLNIRGERSVTCKAVCDAPPSSGPLPASCPAECDGFRRLPDALERASELDAQYGRNPDLARLPMYCAVFSLKNWYDARDMRATGGQDVNFAMDVPKADSPNVADLRDKGAIIYAVSTAYPAGPQVNNGNVKPKTFLPDGNLMYGVWGGQACNPYDTERVPRGTSNGSAAAVAANLVTCSICEQSSASCKGPASRNNVVTVLATKGVMMDGGLGYANPGDRAGIMCRTVEDAAHVLDAVKGFRSGDVFTAAVPPGLIPSAPYASFVAAEGAAGKPLAGMRVAVVREFMVKHTKNDVAISDQIDREIKSVLRDRLGADLVESVDPLYADDPAVPNMTYSFQDAFAEILPAVAPELFARTTPSGELEFAVPGFDVTSLSYLTALSLRKAPLSNLINIRRIGGGMSNTPGVVAANRYLAARGDARIKDWASWVANAKFGSEAQRLAAANAATLRAGGAPGAISYLKMQSVMRMVVQKVMSENRIDAFVNPEQTTPPYKLGGPAEPEVNRRPSASCCMGFTALIGGPEIDVPAGYVRDVYEPRYVLDSTRTQYLSESGQTHSTLPHPMPISLMLWAAPGGEPGLLTIASAYERATHHRKPPPAFGPLPKEPQ